MNFKMSKAVMLAAVLTIALACVYPMKKVSAADAVAAAEWPQWRGPSRDGIAPAGPKLLDAWPKEGPARVWKSDVIPGLRLDGGVGSVVVAEGKVVVFANTRGTGKPVKIATPEHLKRWGWVPDMPDDIVAKVEKLRLAIDRRRRPGLLQDSQISLLFDSLTPDQVAKYGEVIKTRVLYTIRRRDHGEMHEGLLTWKATAALTKLMDKEYTSLSECWKDLSKFAEGNDWWILHELVADAFPSFDSVICLDAATGQQVWRKDVPGFFRMGNGGAYWSASATPAISGGRCYVQGSAGFYCLSLKDGAVLWQQPSEYSSSSPLVLNGIVYAMTPWVTAFKADTGQILWLQDKGQAWNDFPTSLVPWTNGGKLTLISIGADNAPYCIDAENGQIVWETAKDRVNSCATPVIIGDVILGVGGNTAMKLTPQGVEKIWTMKEYRGGNSSLICSQDLVYAHMNGGPFCFDLKTGEMKWKGPGNYSGDCNSAILADGKFMGCWGTENNQELVLYKAGSAKYEELGRFKVNTAVGTSPALVGGKLFVRLEDGIACYDVEKH